METSGQLNLPLFGDESTSSRAGSPANLFLTQESSEERTTTATSGRRCLEQFGRFSRAGSWARTFAGFLLMQGAWYSSRCALTWKLSATKCNRYLFQLAPSMRPTGGTGSGLLPTAVTEGMTFHMDGKDSQVKMRGKALRRAVTEGLLPTPRATEIIEHPDKQAQRLGDRTGTKLNNLSSGAAFGLLPTPLATDIAHPERVRELKEAGGDTFFSRKNGETRPNGLTDFLDYHGLLPTPNAIEGTKGTRTYNPNSQNGRGLSAMACSGMLPSPDANRGKDGSESRRIGHASQLNPLFVAEMMGYPLDWLVSPFQGGGGKPSNASATR